MIEIPRTDRERAEQMLGLLRSMGDRAEQSRFYGPARCRADQLASIEATLSAVRAEAQQEERQRCARVARGFSKSDSLCQFDEGSYWFTESCKAIAAAIEAGEDGKP